MQRSREAALLAALVRLADTLVSDFDLIDLVHDLVVSCVDLLDVAEAGLLLVDGSGKLAVAATTGEAARVLEATDLADSGPGTDTFRTGRVVRSSSARTENRWPEFSRAAHDAGFPAFAVVPLHLRHEILGALTLFSSTADGLSDSDLTVAEGLADLTTIAFLQNRMALDTRKIVADLQTALDTRVLLEQAKGMVASRSHVGMDEAFRTIRQYARTNNERLRRVAEAIVMGDLEPEGLGETPPI